MLLSNGIDHTLKIMEVIVVDLTLYSAVLWNPYIVKGVRQYKKLANRIGQQILPPYCGHLHLVP